MTREILVTKVIKYLNKKMERNFLFLFFFLIFIGFVRNFFEAMGNTSGFMTGYYLSIPSLFNTTSYVFLMIIAEGYLINMFFKGTSKQLRQLIIRGAWLLLFLFITIPVLNYIFNYYFFHFPIYYKIDLIPKDFFAHYGPVGIHVAFFLVLFFFPFWLKKFYKCSLLKPLLFTWFFYGAHYLYTYQVAMGMFFGDLIRYTIFAPYHDLIFVEELAMAKMVNMYTASFVVPTLIIFPFFREKYSQKNKDYIQTTVVYFLLWILFLSLFFINLPWKL